MPVGGLERCITIFSARKQRGERDGLVAQEHGNALAAIDTRSCQASTLDQTSTNGLDDHPRPEVAVHSSRDCVCSPSRPGNRIG